MKKINRAKTVLLHLKDDLKVSPLFAFSLVFDCLVKDGKVDDVETLWGEIGGCGINLSDYVIYVCKLGELEEVKRVCERILMGSRVLGRQSYLALIGALCRYDEGLMAKSVLYEMYCRGFGVDDITYIVLFQCFCRNGDLVEADWVLRKMVKGDSHVDVCIYGSFMHGLCKAGKFREANKLFNKLMKRDYSTGSKIPLLKAGRRGIFQLKCEGVVSEMMVYEMYFRSLCSTGKLAEAEMLLKKMMKKRSMPQVCVYDSFIKALFRAGREDDAIKFFYIECKKGLVCSDDLARFVIMQLCVNGRVDDAMRIFNEFGKTSMCFDVILCNCLVGSLWAFERAIEAEAFFEKMNEGDLAPPNPSTYKLMVCGFCDQGNLTKALDILEKMPLKNIPIDRSIYETVIRSLLKSGRLAEAYRYLDEMTKGGSIVCYPWWKRVFYSLLSDG